MPSAARGAAAGERDEFADADRAADAIVQPSARIDLVARATPDAHALEEPGALEVGEDPEDPALGEVGALGEIPDSRVRRRCGGDEHPSVIRQ